jgi:hypothetical protein
MKLPSRNQYHARNATELRTPKFLNSTDFIGFYVEKLGTPVPSPPAGPTGANFHEIWPASERRLGEKIARCHGGEVETPLTVRSQLNPKGPAGHFYVV